ncbi:hypothetical protein V6N13_098973 [Hibiscus sabdariffa]|uniref:Uncharacterized protein n=1 Tax=Hibiscus sabdariffa TaxID=183260 RepID=A0ABR2P923_9ROSI
MGKPIAKLPAIASRDKVIQVDTSLNLENRAAVHIDSTRGGPKPSVSNARNQSLSNNVTGVKANRVSSLLSDLDKDKAEVDRPLGNANTIEEALDAII